MRPSRALTIYYAVTFAAGAALTVLVAVLMHTHHDELGVRGAAIMTLSWNVLFILILPLVLDWSERKYFRARFIKIEEVASSHPELAAVLAQQCKKLSIERLRLAIVDAPGEEVFGYGLWGSNPRLVLSGALFKSRQKARMLPSIEAELMRVKSQDNATVFLIFAVLQVICQHIILACMQA